MYWFRSDEIPTCGLVTSLSVMVSVPVLVPVAAGVKVTVIVHVGPSLYKLLPQVYSW